MPTVSDAIAEAYASAPSDLVVLHTLELRHPSFVDDYGRPIALRVVRDTQAVTAVLEADAPMDAGNGVEFLPFPFDFALPEQNGAGAIPEIVLTIDNVSAYIVQYLDLAAASVDPIEMTYRPYLSTDLSAPHMDPVITLLLKNIEATVLRVTARAVFGDLANRRFPAMDYTPERFPGLAAA
jgi:hypothetical protein